ncbi:MAG: hypothetical protein DRI24_01730 [Deltaproteobacteria bacterium]|nr:MAG: hypothetical protein DRI24_01730 [Deltaproteobacteria bacterium]
MLLGRFRVQPAENRKFTVDYGEERLQDDNLLFAVNSVTVDVVTDPPFTVTAGMSADQKNVVLFTAGGVSNTQYKVEITVSAEDSQIWQDEIIYQCEDV